MNLRQARSILRSYLRHCAAQLTESERAALRLIVKEHEPAHEARRELENAARRFGNKQTDNNLIALGDAAQYFTQALRKKRKKKV